MEFDLLYLRENGFLAVYLFIAAFAVAVLAIFIMVIRYFHLIERVKNKKTPGNIRLSQTRLTKLFKKIKAKHVRIAFIVTLLVIVLAIPIRFDIARKQEKAYYRQFVAEQLGFSEDEVEIISLDLDQKATILDSPLSKPHNISVPLELLVQINDRKVCFLAYGKNPDVFYND